MATWTHFLVILIIELTLASLATFKNVYLRKESCTRPEHVSSDVIFRKVFNKIQCGKLYLESNKTFQAMLVYTQPDGAIFCGLISQLPTFSTCLNDTSDILVYTQPVLPNCTVQCDFRYDLQGISYCAYRTTIERTYQESIDYCNSIGGTLAEAETMQHVDIMASISGPNTLLYLGGNDFETEGVFKWHRGDIVSNTFFHPLEPNNHRGIEHCLVFYRDGSGTYGLGDMSCDWPKSALCALRCQ